MKKLLLLLAVAGMVGVSAGEARAQASFGAQASFADDMDLGVGARVYLGLPWDAMQFVGSFDYFFPDSDVLDYFELNANAVYALSAASAPSFFPYVGGGLNLARYGFDFGELGDDSEIEMGLNAIGGAEFGTGPVKPFAELRLELRDGGQFVLAGGVHF